MTTKQIVAMIVFGTILFTLSRYGVDGIWRIAGLGVAVCGLGLLVLIHELGHFLGGRFGRMAIESFQVGFGKPIVSRLWGETEWKLCMFPFGGAVKFVSENGDEQTSMDFSDQPGRASLMDQSRWFSNRPWPLQMLTLAAGPAFSIAFAVPLLWTCYVVFGTPNTEVPPVVAEVSADTPAGQAGLQVGDLLLSVNGSKVQTAQQAMEQFKRSSDAAQIVVARGAMQHEFKVLPIALGKRRLFGVVFATPPRPNGPVEALNNATANSVALVKEQGQGIYGLLTGQISLKHVSGPVGIINITGKVAQTGPQRLLLLLAAITVGLGLTNLIPIPVMDGGRIVILLIRQFIGKRAADYYEPIALGAGLVMVLVIFAAVTIKDFLTL